MSREPGEKARCRKLAAEFRERARNAKRLGWRAEMFDCLRAAAYYVVLAVKS